MNIYLIWQDVNNDYDTHDSAVVVAESEEDAKTIHPRGGENKAEVEGWNDWACIKDVKVELIGKADKSMERGVVCASFNAG